MQTTALARSLSIAGHPALLMPVAVALSAALRGAPVAMTFAVVGLAVVVAVMVGLFSLRQVRAGRWSHMDASVPRERLHLNLFLSALLLGLAALATVTRQPPVLAAGALACAMVVLVAMALRQWLKTSLHAAFGAFAALLVWPLWPAFVPIALLAAGVAWSRLVLRRHTRAEVAVGLVLGTVAGAAFLTIAVRAPAA